MAIGGSGGNLFDFSGIEEEIARFEQMGVDADEAIEAAVTAGSKALAEELKQAAPVHTGKLSKSIRASKVAYDPGNGFYCTVRPEGKDRHGEPYAKIGNILEYGRSNMPPRPWFEPAKAAAESRVIELMRAVFLEKMEGRE